MVPPLEEEPEAPLEAPVEERGVVVPLAVDAAELEAVGFAVVDPEALELPAAVVVEADVAAPAVLALPVEAWLVVPAPLLLQAATVKLPSRHQRSRHERTPSSLKSRTLRQSTSPVADTAR